MAAKKDESMLPDESSDGIAFDASELRVDFSEKELASEARDFTPMPTGKYNVAVTEVEVKACGPESKNPGKPYWALTLVVQDGKYEDRKLWSNVMLFSPALFSYVQIAKALGGEWEASITPGNAQYGKIPHGDKLVGQMLTVNVAKQVDQYKIDRDGLEDGEPKPFKNEVKNYSAAGAGTISAGSDSLLPG
jgi:hypothetical protein